MKTIAPFAFLILLLTACAPAAPATPDFGEVPDFAMENLIPALSMPPDAQQYGGGGGGGDNGMELGVAFSSELSAEEVYQHYSEQLQAAGWRFISREDKSDGLLSFWKLTDSVGAIWPARLNITVGSPEDPDAYNVYVMVLQPH